MAKFCQQCGSTVDGQMKFCSKCGAPLTPTAQQPTPYAMPVQGGAPSGFAGGGTVREGIPMPGFSDRVNHPEILAAVKKNRKAAKIFSLILVPLPLIGFMIYAAVSKEMEIGQAALYGGAISAIFLIFALISFIRERAKNTYEGVVIEKRTRDYYQTKGDDTVPTTEYIVKVRTADGKKKKIVESSNGMVVAYNYLQEGDRFRYHPQFHFPYELYDKRRAPYIACVSCGTHNPIEADRCKRCKLPLLK